MTDFERFTTSLVTGLVAEGSMRRVNIPLGGFRIVSTGDWRGSLWRQSCERSTPCFEKRVSSQSTKH
jgi:hypothetical protein